MGNTVVTQQDQLANRPQPEENPSQKSGTHNNTPVDKDNHHVNEPNNNKDAKKELPCNFKEIIKENPQPFIDEFSEDLYKNLHTGVYLDDRKKKYWLDKNNYNCFMVFANGLKITWGGTRKYWNLHPVKASDNGNITVAQLKNVCWLEVHGRLNIAHLSPGITYQVSFEIMLEYTSYGWEVPVKFRLSLPGGITKPLRKENLKDKPKGEWLRIPVGEFEASPDNVGEIQFSLYEYDGGNWKKGLVVKCAIIEPKYN